jgi:hypothetical protein
MLLSSALLPFQLNSIYADESETNTEQGLGQENIGSGESVNTNCAQNLIKSFAIIDCEDGITSTPTPPISPSRAFFSLFLDPRSCLFRIPEVITCDGDIGTSLEPPWDRPNRVQCGEYILNPEQTACHIIVANIILGAICDVPFDRDQDIDPVLPFCLTV